MLRHRLVESAEGEEQLHHTARLARGRGRVGVKVRGRGRGRVRG